jgi:sulfur carrier protein ThiS
VEVRLRLNWGLGRYLPGSPVEGMKLALPEGTSMGILLEAYGIPVGEVGLISVNGSLARVDYILRDRDDIQVYPPLDGG